MFKYIHFNNLKKISGIFYSQENMNDPTSPDYGRSDIMLIPDDATYLDTISIGWRLSDDNEWLPPNPPSEEKTLQQEINDISSQLKAMQKREQYLEYLGLNPESEEARTLVPVPVKRVRKTKTPKTLNEMFASLGSRLTGEPASKTKPTQVVSAMAAMLSSEPTESLTKSELIAQLNEKLTRLNEIKNTTA